MNYEPSTLAVAIFAVIVAITLGISFYLGAKAKSAKAYFAAGGGIHWFVNGVAFAGDYLSAASFLGICGMIAFYGYDGFLYSIGYLAGWVVALFVIAEPLKRLGRYTFADALDAKFNSPGIKLSVAISTLAVSIFYLIPQMVGAGTLIKPLLGFPHWVGVVSVGAVVILIVVTAGMVSTTWVQFLKGGLLVIFSAVLVVMILMRGLEAKPASFSTGADVNVQSLLAVKGSERLPDDGPWKWKPYVRIRDEQGEISIWRIPTEPSAGKHSPDIKLNPTQVVRTGPDGKKTTRIASLPAGEKHQLQTVGRILALPAGSSQTGSLSPGGYLSTFSASTIEVWREETITEADGTKHVIYYPEAKQGSDLLQPGNLPAFKGIRGDKLFDKLNFLSLMLALFCGTASLPHILIRYYTVKDQASARKSTIVGIACIGFFYVLTLYIGLGAMTSGSLDPTNSNMAAPLLARSFSEWLFAVISAIAFTTVLGTVSGLIVAASGAVVHDLMSSVWQFQMTDYEKVRSAKWASVVVGIIAIVLGILFEKMNVSYLVGWAFSIAASANLPSLVMLLFWKRTTKQGIIAAVIVGMVSSLTWILLSDDTFKGVYNLPPSMAPMPFSQPGIVTIPLGFLTLIFVSLLTPRPTAVGTATTPVLARRA